MADTYSTFNNSADDFVSQQKKLTDKNSALGAQTYGDVKINNEKLRGKFNQEVTPGGMVTTKEQRKSR